MKISYLIYGLLVTGWVITDAPIHNRSRWWALGIFIFPFLTPLYFIKTRPSNKYWKLIGIWIVGFMMFHTTEVMLLKKTNIQQDEVPLLATKKIDLDWKKINIGSSGFSISSPTPIKPVVREIPQKIQSNMVKSEFYECDANNFRLLITKAEYQPGKVMELTEAVTGTVSNLSNVVGISNLQYSQKTILVSGRKGSLLEGSFISGGKEIWSFGCAIILDKQEAWQVLGMYIETNQEGKDIIKRILSSIEFQERKM